MSRYHRGTRSLLLRLVGVALAATVLVAQPSSQTGSVIPLLLARHDPPPASYHALRHLDAENARFGAHAWMDAWTTVDANRFDIDIVGEGGSGYVRSHVLRPALEAERKMFLAGDPAKAALSEANYTFADDGASGDGLTLIAVKPRRKDILLVDGHVTVKAADGDLVRIEGRLSKTPSFWTRRVEVDRRYDRIDQVRVPVSIESVATVLIAGRSTFRMTYEYETINGRHVGDPRVRTATETEKH